MLKRETILAIFISTIALLIAIGKPVLTLLPTDETEARSVTVSAIGEAYQVADGVYFDVYSREYEVDADELEDSLSDLMEDIDILTTDEAIDSFTSNFYLYIAYDYDNNNHPTPRSLTPNLRNRIVIYDLSRFNEVLVALAELELGSIDSTYYFLNDSDNALQEAEQDALEEARARAEHLAALEGYELGDVLLMDVTSPSTSTYNVSPNAQYNDDSLTDELLINPSPVRVSVTATVTFELR